MLCLYLIFHLIRHCHPDIKYFQKGQTQIVLDFSGRYILKITSQGKKITFGREIRLVTSIVGISQKHKGQNFRSVREKGFELRSCISQVDAAISELQTSDE